MSENNVWHVVVGDDGAVTLPRELCEQLGLGEGSQVDVVEEKGLIVLRPIQHAG